MLGVLIFKPLLITIVMKKPVIASKKPPNGQYILKGINHPKSIIFGLGGLFRCLVGLSS